TLEIGVMETRNLYALAVSYGIELDLNGDFSKWQNTIPERDAKEIRAYRGKSYDPSDHYPEGHQLEEMQRNYQNTMEIPIKLDEQNELNHLDNNHMIILIYLNIKNMIERCFDRDTGIYDEESIEKFIENI